MDNFNDSPLIHITAKNDSSKEKPREDMADNREYSSIEEEKTIELNEDQKNLIKILREEAYHVKDCFTKFSFQAIVFASLALGVLAKIGLDILSVSIVCISVVFILLTVARIGTYKYGTANRHYGYELYLYRSKYSLPDSPLGWKPYMKSIGWEEALRAWRVVQATVFEYLYYHGIWPNYLKKFARKEKKELRWFQPEVLVKKGSTYYAGSYLESMLQILHVLALLSATPILIFIIGYIKSFSGKLSWEFFYSISIFPALLIMIIFNILRNRARREILEGGILSIHSCAIMWQAVVVAHYRALAKSKKEERGFGYKNYTRYLSEEAISLKENIFNIHQWIHEPPEKK